MRITRCCVIPGRLGGLACVLVLVLGGWLMTARPAPAQTPVEATEQPWRIASLPVLRSIAAKRLVSIGRVT